MDSIELNGEIYNVGDEVIVTQPALHTYFSTHNLPADYDRSTGQYPGTIAAIAPARAEEWDDEDEDPPDDWEPEMYPPEVRITYFSVSGSLRQRWIVLHEKRIQHAKITSRQGLSNKLVQMYRSS